MKYKIKHIVYSIKDDILYLYGYDNSGKIAFSVNCQDKIQYRYIEITSEIFVMIGQYKVLSVYMTKFLNNPYKQFLEIIEDDKNDAEKGNDKKLT